MKVPSPEEIEAAMTPNGGWTRKQLAEWGIPWPPPKNWRERLEWRYKVAGSTSPQSESPHQAKVLAVFPFAYLYQERTTREIRRPREITDPSALVKYVSLSGIHWTGEAAWEDAAKRLL